MTSVFPATPINICSLLSSGILFVLIIPLELHGDNRNETRGILPPSHTLHLHNLPGATRGGARRDATSGTALPPPTVFPGQVLSGVAAQAPSCSQSCRTPRRCARSTKSSQAHIESQTQRRAKQECCRPSSYRRCSSVAILTLINNLNIKDTNFYCPAPRAASKNNQLKPQFILLL